MALDTTPPEPETLTEETPAEARTEAEEEAEEAPQSKLKSMGWHLLTFAILVLLITSARWSLADHYQVPTGSMRPTVAIDDRILVNKLSYGIRVPFTSWNLVDFEGPQHGDVVVLDSPEGDQTLLKRVIALPGDRIEVRGGRLFLNATAMEVELDGEQMIEDLNGIKHNIRLTRQGGPELKATVVPDDKYLVMGDNRGESRDGRTFGFVPRSSIFGKAVGVYWREGGLAWEDL